MLYSKATSDFFASLGQEIASLSKTPIKGGSGVMRERRLAGQGSVKAEHDARIAAADWPHPVTSKAR